MKYFAVVSQENFKKERKLLEAFAFYNGDI